jgi:hypothetical protein
MTKPRPFQTTLAGVLAIMGSALGHFSLLFLALLPVLLGYDFLDNGPVSPSFGLLVLQIPFAILSVPFVLPLYIWTSLQPQAQPPFSAVLILTVANSILWGVMLLHVVLRLERARSSLFVAGIRRERAV